MTQRYQAWNGPMPTTAAQVGASTGTTIKTMLQIAVPSSRDFSVLAWGFQADALQSGVVELLQTDVAATVTAHVAAGVQPLDAGMTASLATLGTSATGYTATVEGSITATRVFDLAQLVTTTGDKLGYSYQFMPDER